MNLNKNAVNGQIDDEDVQNASVPSNGLVTQQSGASNQNNESSTQSTPSTSEAPAAPSQPVTSASQQQTPPAPKTTPVQTSITQQIAQKNATQAPQQNIGAGNQTVRPEQKKSANVGTGYTNLNRIMQANQGNKLAQTVSGGITNQVNQLQSGVKSAQDRFNEAAQKARLDTDENRGQVQNVLDRFDESKVNVDESQFQLGEDLQSDYDQKQNTLQNELKKAQETGQGNIQEIDDEIAFTKYAIDALTKAGTIKSGGGYRTGPGGVITSRPTIERLNINAIKALPDSPYKQKLLSQLTSSSPTSLKTYTGGLSGLENLKKAVSTANQVQTGTYEEQLSNLNKNFQDLNEAEKAKWIQAERDRIVAENLPDQQELEAFRKFTSGAYSGPKELQDFQSLLGTAQQTEDLGTLSRLQGGRQELLKQFVGGNDYNFGQRQLDEAILGQSDNSLLSKAAKKALGAERTVTDANQLARAEAANLQGQAQKFGEEVRGNILDARNPLSQKINEQMSGLQQQEATRQQDFTKIQDILSGKDANTKNHSPEARLGLALQFAQDAGHLSQGEISDLVGKGGLIDRARMLGLDPSQMIMERLNQSSATGIDRRAAATSDQEKRISALDRLLGKTGTDVEFGYGQENYQAGDIGLDMANLLDHISKEEQNKMGTGYSEQLAQAGISPLQQVLGGFLNNVTGQFDLNAQKALGGSVDMSEGLLNLNKDLNVKALSSINDLFGGNKEIGKLLDSYSKAYSGVVGGGANELRNVLSAEDDLRSGRLDQALSKLTGLDTAKNVSQNVYNELSKGITNVGQTLSTALFGGETGNWNPNKYGTTDFSTGKATNIGAFANRSSDDIMQQMMQVQLDIINSPGGKHGKTRQVGSRMMNQLLQYYYKALEQGR